MFVFLLIKCSQNSLGAVVILPLVSNGHLYRTLNRLCFFKPRGPKQAGQNEYHAINFTLPIHSEYRVSLRVIDGDGMEM